MNPDAWLTGRRGQGLAVAIGVLLVALVWFGVVDPAWSWYEDRELLLEQRQGMLRHMQDLAASLPSLRAASEAKPGRGEGLGMMMLPGATDAVAAADLQERIQHMASSAGASLTAVETLPATPSGKWHKVSLRISLNAPWPVLMELMRSVEQSPTRILIDDVHFHSATVVSHPTAMPIQASMVVYGFSAAEAGAGI
jgi:general secretion pathway protein M